MCTQFQYLLLLEVTLPLFHQTQFIFWFAGGPTANCQLKQEQLIERRSILKKYILNEQDALQALLAIQNMVHRSVDIGNIVAVF